MRSGRPVGRSDAHQVATSTLHVITLFNCDVWALERDAPEAATKLRELLEQRTASAL